MQAWYAARTAYEAWLHDIGQLFEIIRLRGGGFRLALNFEPQAITLLKDAIFDVLLGVVFRLRQIQSSRYET